MHEDTAAIRNENYDSADSEQRGRTHRHMDEYWHNEGPLSGRYLLDYFSAGVYDFYQGWLLQCRALDIFLPVL